RVATGALACENEHLRPPRRAAPEPALLDPHRAPTPANTGKERDHQRDGHVPEGPWCRLASAESAAPATRARVSVAAGAGAPGVTADACGRQSTRAAPSAS